MTLYFVEELPNSGSTRAPGWTYVADTGFDPTKSQIQPSGRKRNARVAGLGRGGDTTARQQAAVLKKIAELDKDNHRDTHIPVPSKQNQGGGRVTKGKTAATRKILLAQKTFNNYLADEEALAAQEAQNVPGPRSKFYTGNQRQASKGKETPAPEAGESSSPTKTSTMLHAQHTGPAHLATDDSRLLEINVPSAPSEAIMEALTTAPALSYNAARVTPSSSGKPVRHFCELCGYWGTIKCIYCGVRVCGLDCKRVHDEDRCQKYPG